METEKSKIKVLHVLNSNSYSGAENVAITIINGIKEEFEVAYTSPDGSIRNYLKENNIKYFPIYERSLTVKEFKRIVYTYKPDIIHAHDFTASVVSAVVARKNPIINHLHNNCPWLKKYSLKTFAYLGAAIRANKILTVSNSVMDEYVFGRFLEKKTKVIGNPVDIEAIQKKAEEAILKEPSDLIFLGRLSTPKNPMMFIDIVSEIVKFKADLRVAIVGTGELESEVKNKCKALKLDNNIKFYGFQKNPYGLLKASKILCMPSLWEGFGLAAIEALALGVPVIAAPVGGIVNIVTNDCGCLCEDKDEFVKVIYSLLCNEINLKKKSYFAKTRAEKLDNVDIYRQKINRLYLELLYDK